jgi:hypothetical protein
MELTCPAAQAFSTWLGTLTQTDADQLAQQVSLDSHQSLLTQAGVDFDQCDKVQLLAVIRDRVAALTDEDLATIAGGEKLVAKVVAAATVPVAAGVAAGVVVGGVVGGAASTGYYGATHQL